MFQQRFRRVKERLEHNNSENFLKLINYVVLSVVTVITVMEKVRVVAQAVTFEIHTAVFFLVIFT